MIKVATLTYVSAKEPPFLPPDVASLSDEESDFLQRHVDDLRRRAESSDALRSQFQVGADTRDLFQRLLKASDVEVSQIAEVIVSRLAAQMKASTTPKAGILAVVVSGPSDGAEHVSVLKLEAIHEAAKFERMAKGRIRLQVLKDLLPAPGQLQKGVSWPDVRETSDAIIQDTNVEAARYFFNAVQLNLSPRATQTERVLVDQIIRKAPPDKARVILADAAARSGPAEKIVAALQQEYPGFTFEAPELSTTEGRVAGIVREGRLAARRLKITGDGIDIVVPFDRLDQVTGPEETGGQWIFTVRMNTPPNRGVG